MNRRRAAGTSLSGHVDGGAGGIACASAPAQQQATSLTEQAARCRRLSLATHDRSASAMLSRMAEDYAAEADALRQTD